MSNTKKMIIAVVHDNDAHDLMANLTSEGYQATKMASTGGFLREGNTTFIIGTGEANVEEVLDIINDNCKTRERTIAPMSPVADSLAGYYTFPMDIQIGGATVFILDVEKFIKM